MDACNTSCNLYYNIEGIARMVEHSCFLPNTGTYLRGKQSLTASLANKIKRYY